MSSVEKEAVPARRERSYLPTEQRRAQIVDAAIDLMAERGLMEVSIRDVAHAAGVPLSSINYHFGSRDDLLAAVMESMTDKFCEVVLAAAPDPGDLDEVLWRQAETIATGTNYSPGYHMLLLEFTLYAVRRPESGLAQSQYTKYQEVGRRIVGRICSQTDTRFVGDLDAIVKFLIAIMEGTTLQQLAAGDPLASRPLLQELNAYMRPHFAEVTDDGGRSGASEPGRSR